MFSIGKLKKGVRQPFCLSKAGACFPNASHTKKGYFFQAENLQKFLARHLTKC